MYMLKSLIVTGANRSEPSELPSAIDGFDSFDEAADERRESKEWKEVERDSDSEDRPDAPDMPESWWMCDVREWEESDVAEKEEIEGE